MDRNEQLEGIERELAEVTRRAHEMAAPLNDRTWSARPKPAEWSAAECLVHLNLTSRAFLPLIREALGKGRAVAPARRTRYRMDVTGRILWLALTARLPIKTTEPFVPLSVEAKDNVLGDFDALQEALAGCLKDARDLDLGARRIVSPFDARLEYNVYSCFRAITAHERLHLRQGERAVAAVLKATIA